MRNSENMPQRGTVSVIVPALNEAPFLQHAVGIVTEAAQQHFSEHEIIIVDDGSTDGTGDIADALAGADERITVIHHDQPRNLGGAFKSGLKRASMQFVALYHGKGGNSAEEMGKIWALAGSADIIVPYSVNAGERPAYSRLVSGCLTQAFVLATGVKLKYFTHLVLYRREDLNTIAIITDSYAFQAEAVCKLIRANRTYHEVGVIDAYEDGGPTRSYRLRNITAVLKCLLQLFWTLRLQRRG